MYDFGIIGCGDIGLRVARILLQQGSSIYGLVHSEASAEKGRAAGLEMFQADLDAPHSLPPLPSARRILYFAPPQPSGQTDTRIVAALDRLESSPERIVLISTTGIYGDAGGSWISEHTIPAPSTDRGRRRLHAEQALQQWCNQHDVEWVILRVPGIYAESRLPRARLERGEPVLHSAEAPFTNRIHAHDLARLCITAMEKAPEASTYNATDGHPSSMTAYFDAVADHLNLPRPPQISLREAKDKLSAGMLSYLSESRRISNEKLLRELDFQFQYPSLAEGLGKH